MLEGIDEIYDGTVAFASEWENEDICETKVCFYTKYSTKRD
jgi:hypothetical protein